MAFSAHPLWLVGFRPFFALACFAGLSLPVVWTLFLSGTLALPAWPFSATQWHAHEMFFGFGWAVLGGFLLTATKNWVKVRGYYGSALLFLAGAWLVERAGMWFAGDLPLLLFRLSNNLFLASIVGMLAWTLLRYHRQDSFRDNYLLLIILPLFLLAKNLLLSTEYFQLGANMALGLFRVAFLVMLERTVTQFMRNSLHAEILRNETLDRAIKFLALFLVVSTVLPKPIAAWTSLLLALLLVTRLLFWKPLLALRHLEIGIMYLGHLAIVGQLLVAFIEHFGQRVGIGSPEMHVFTFGAMGLIIPAMLIRIVKGHTGRKVAFDSLDRIVLWLMIVGFVIRVILPPLDPVHYPRWIEMAAACWFACFAILGSRYIPFLVQPRVDGKEH